MTADDGALRDQYLAAIEHEITSGRSRLAAARRTIPGDVPPRAAAVAAIADVTLDWLEAERDRVRAGQPFDVESARRLLEGATTDD